mgnify:CR=1 FL=1
MCGTVVSALLPAEDVRVGALSASEIKGRHTTSAARLYHLPGGGDLVATARDSFSETDMEGVGFGLGFAILLDRGRNRSAAANGLFTWGGAASTSFWVDPVEDLTVTFFTQLLPSSTYPVRRLLQRSVYQAVVE